MSLVNEMLNELQKDQKNSSNFAQGLSAAKPSPLLKLKIPVLIIIFFVLTVLLFNLIQSSPDSDSFHLLKTPMTVASTLNKENLERTIQAASDSSEDSTKLVKDIDVEEGNGELPNSETIEPIVKSKPMAVVKIPTKAIEKPLAIENNIELTKQKLTSSTSTNPKPIIRLSRRTEANKRLSGILDSWGQQDSTTNRIQIETLLNDYRDLSDVWLKTINSLGRKSSPLQQKYLDQALIKFPEQDAFKILLAKQLTNNKQYSSALAILIQTNKKDWSQTQYRLAGFLSQKTTNHSKAIEYYNHLLIINPNLGDVNMAVAISLEAINENKLAVLKFRRALEDNKLSDLQKQFINQRIAAIQG